MTDVTDLIWLQTAFMGDIVLTTAATQAAHKAFPHVKQHVITTRVGASVLSGEATVESLVVFDKHGRGLFEAFRAVRSELEERLGSAKGVVLLQPHRSQRSSLLARYLGYPTITYRETHLGRLAKTRVARVAALHEAARIGLLLEPLGIARQAIVAARPSLSPLPLMLDGDWQESLKNDPRRAIGMAPGSVWATKRWTEEGFTELARRLLNASDDILVLLGSAAEAPLTERLAKALDRPSRVLDLAGVTKIDDLRRIYPRLALVVANDSSAVHYAAAFDIPTVAVFGATVPGMGFAPLATKSMSVGIELACRPCGAHGPARCPLGHFKCMRELTADRVFEACRNLL